MTGLRVVQVQDWHVSVCVHALPSLQAVPLAAFGFEQTPVDVLQVPATWHWSEAVQTTGFDPVQVPFWQVSGSVEAMPALQSAALAACGLAQTPIDVLQVPATWHW